jgi:hypothetical protein
MPSVNAKSRANGLSLAGLLRQVTSALVCALLGLMLLPILAQAQQVTTEMIGPLSGTLTINFPSGACFGQQDTINFTGNVHVVAIVDAAQGTVDYHINLLGVKGTGNVVAKYVANGATDLLDQNFPGTQPQPSPIKANLYPTGPCRAGFPSTGALPIVLTVTFGSDFTLNSVSAVIGQT